MALHEPACEFLGQPLHSRRETNTRGNVAICLTGSSAPGHKDWLFSPLSRMSWRSTQAVACHHQLTDSLFLPQPDSELRLPANGDCGYPHQAAVGEASRAKAISQTCPSAQESANIEEHLLYLRSTLKKSILERSLAQCPTPQNETKRASATQNSLTQQCHLGPAGGSRVTGERLSQYRSVWSAAVSCAASGCSGGRHILPIRHKERKSTRPAWCWLSIAQPGAQTSGLQMTGIGQIRGLGHQDFLTNKGSPGAGWG